MPTPDQFTGQAGFGPAKDEAFELRAHRYTPRTFTDNDVIIKVLACRLCGTDVQALEAKNSEGGADGPWPLITGHEVVGEVVKAGSKSGRREGERVGMGGQVGSCRECGACKSHNENYCPKIVFAFGGPTGSAEQPRTCGGFADYVQLPGKFAIPLPDGIATTSASPLLCAGVTTYTPLKQYGVGPGSKVGVVGIGGLGHLGIQFANALGASTYALSMSISKREDALALGAEGFIDCSSPNHEKVLSEYTNFFDVILVTSYANDMPMKELYMPMVGLHGHLVILGQPDRGLPHWGVFDFLGKSITGSLMGSPQDQEDMLKLAAEKGIKPRVEERPMSEINAALEDFRAGKPRYRYVLVN